MMAWNPLPKRAAHDAIVPPKRNWLHFSRALLKSQARILFALGLPQLRLPGVAMFFGAGVSGIAARWVNPLGVQPEAGTICAGLVFMLPGNTPRSGG